MGDFNSKSIFLFRFTELLDSVLHYLLPSWNYSAGSFKDLEVLHTFFFAAEILSEEGFTLLFGKCMMSVFCVKLYVIVKAVYRVKDHDLRRFFMR